MNDGILRARIFIEICVRTCVQDIIHRVSFTRLLFVYYPAESVFHIPVDRFNTRVALYTLYYYVRIGRKVKGKKNTRTNFFSRIFFPSTFFLPSPAPARPRRIRNPQHRLNSICYSRRASAPPTHCKILYAHNITPGK